MRGLNYSPSESADQSIKRDPTIFNLDAWPFPVRNEPQQAKTLEEILDTLPDAPY